jgi:Domain of unknown function (DUF4926)
MIPCFSRVMVLTDKYGDRGVPCGARGYVIEVYDNGEYEVEFSGADGVNYASIVAVEAEIKPSEPGPK